jgi:enoyl-CoA hydratase/carnithine racemase
VSTELIKCDVEDHIALVTMDHPPVNAQNMQFMEEMMLVFDAISDRDEVRVAVLTGAGKVFSAGADLKGRTGREPQPGDHWQRSRAARETYHSVMECKKPVIGALNGPALGAGLAVAASCDILVASENASLGLPEIDVGLLGGGRHTMRLFCHSRARRMMLTGYRVPGPELYRLGVVEACVPPEKLMDEAMGLAREIAAKSPVAIPLRRLSLRAEHDRRAGKVRGLEGGHARLHREAPAGLQGALSEFADGYLANPLPQRREAELGPVKLLLQKVSPSTYSALPN